MRELNPVQSSSDAPVQGERPKRDVFPAMWRGARGRCPSCGEGPLFERYLKFADHCPHCGEALHHQRADDAPPYFTILIAGHLIVPLLLYMEAALRPAIWVHMLVWGPASIAVCLLLLPIVKGAIVGLQWANYMHGFDPAEEDTAFAAKEGLS